MRKFPGLYQPTNVPPYQRTTLRRICAVAYQLMTPLQTIGTNAGWTSTTLLWYSIEKPDGTIESFENAVEIYNLETNTCMEVTSQYARYTITSMY